MKTIPFYSGIVKEVSPGQQDSGLKYLINGVRPDMVTLGIETIFGKTMAEWNFAPQEIIIEAPRGEVKVGDRVRLMIEVEETP